MRRVLAFVLAVSVCIMLFSVTAVAVDSEGDAYLEDDLPLGASVLEEVSFWLPALLEEMSNREEGEDIIPPIHEHMVPLGASSMGIMPLSIGTQPNFPYTGGGFMAVNTNYGNGLLVFPDPYRRDTFGFLKGTDRVINLTNSTINGYFIMGSTTYSARIQRFMEPEYAYVSGSTTTWRTLTVSALTDSNIQFLDETGERGIQRPFLTLTDKLLLVFIFMELFIHGIGLLRRR